MTPTRTSADERRQEIVAAARIEFARGGYDGTSTAAIARRVGVSQPYLFQLFKSKKELFLAAVVECFAEHWRTFERAGTAARAETDDPKMILAAMGRAYHTLLGDRDMLRMQLQAYAACDDPEIQAVVRERYAALWEGVQRLSGADDRAVEAWFGEGMLLNVLAALGVRPETPDSLCLDTFHGIRPALR